MHSTNLIQNEKHFSTAIKHILLVHWAEVES